MLTKNQIDEISNFIYKMPDAFYECQKHLDEGDITAAMELFRGSETFKAYFATIVNLGDFGVQNHTRDIYAIAYPLGIDNLKMIICSYFVSSCLRANFAYILRADLFKVSTLA